MADYTLHSTQSSGNCYKPRLLMHQLGIDFRLVDTDSTKGETRTPEFLALNPNGRVPLLILPDGRLLPESNAMLLYLAEGTKYLPAERYDRGICYHWLFFEQYEHEPSIAVARSWLAIYPDRIARRRRNRSLTGTSAASAPFRSWKSGWRRTNGWPARPIRSPISPSTPTPTSPVKAASTSPPTRASPRG